MRTRIIIPFILLPLLLMACDVRLFSETTGYIATVDIDRLDLINVDDIEDIMLSNGYNYLWKERVIDIKNPRKKYDFLQKKIVEGHYGSVDIYMYYEISSDENVYRKVHFGISNVYKGLVVNEIKNEIDFISGLIYDYLVTNFGMSSVEIVHKEWGPPGIGFIENKKH